MCLTGNLTAAHYLLSLWEMGKIPFCALPWTCKFIAEEESHKCICSYMYSSAESQDRKSVV